jgi:hypothetical protein
MFAVFGYYTGLMSIRGIILLWIFCAFLPSPSRADQSQPQRGVWFWRTDPVYGADAVLNDPAKQIDALDFFHAQGITKVYGSYGNRTTTSTGAVQMADWNATLDSMGIESQFLMSENSWIFPTNHPSFLTKITQRVADFNNAAGRLPEERFKGLHLDIEPQAIKDSDDGLINTNAWSDLAPTQKRDYLLLLRDTYEVVRNHVDTVLTPGFPVYADLPVWFDNYPGGSIGWTSVADRDQWFNDIATHLTGVTLMPFERLTFSSINNGVDWERNNISGAAVRVALEADDGFWPTEGHFFMVRDQMEAEYGDAQATDFQSYELFREMMADLSAEPIVAHIALPPGSPSAHITVEAAPAFIHILEISADMCRWRTTDTFETPSPREHIFQGDLQTSQGFWRVTRYPLPP